MSNYSNQLKCHLFQVSLSVWLSTPRLSPTPEPSIRTRRTCFSLWAFLHLITSPHSHSLICDPSFYLYKSIEQTARLVHQLFNASLLLFRAPTLLLARLLAFAWALASPLRSVRFVTRWPPLSRRRPPCSRSWMSSASSSPKSSPSSVLLFGWSTSATSMTPSMVDHGSVVPCTTSRLPLPWLSLPSLRVRMCKSSSTKLHLKSRTTCGPWLLLLKKAAAHIFNKLRTLPLFWPMSWNFRRWNFRRWWILTVNGSISSINNSQKCSHLMYKNIVEGACMCIPCVIWNDRFFPFLSDLHLPDPFMKCWKGQNCHFIKHITYKIGFCYLFHKQPQRNCAGVGSSWECVFHLRNYCVYSN